MAIETSNFHSLRRTSPKGGRFLGTCVRCKREGLTSAQANEPCAARDGKTRDDLILEALTDGD